MCEGKRGVGYLFRPDLSERRPQRRRIHALESIWIGALLVEISWPTTMAGEIYLPIALVIVQSR